MGKGRYSQSMVWEWEIPNRIKTHLLTGSLKAAWFGGRDGPEYLETHRIWTEGLIEPGRRHPVHVCVKNMVQKSRYQAFVLCRYMVPQKLCYQN